MVGRVKILLPVGRGSGASGFAALGAGPDPARIQTLTSTCLAELIQNGIEDDRVQKNSAAEGQKIRSEDGIKTAVQLIDQYLVSG